jgi:hypothetical protein
VVDFRHECSGCALVLALVSDGMASVYMMRRMVERNLVVSMVR